MGEAMENAPVLNLDPNSDFAWAIRQLAEGRRVYHPTFLATGYLQRVHFGGDSFITIYRPTGTVQSEVFKPTSGELFTDGWKLYPS